MQQSLPSPSTKIKTMLLFSKPCSDYSGTRNKQTAHLQNLVKHDRCDKLGVSKQALAKHDLIKVNMQKERFVIAHDLRTSRRNENLKHVMTLYRERSPLQDDLITIILLYAGMLFMGKYSICWVQFV